MCTSPVASSARYRWSLESTARSPHAAPKRVHRTASAADYRCSPSPLTAAPIGASSCLAWPATPYWKWHSQSQDTGSAHTPDSPPGAE